MKIAIFEGYNGPGTIKRSYAAPRPYAGYGDTISSVPTSSTECACSWSTPFLAGLVVATLWPFATRMLGFDKD